MSTDTKTAPKKIEKPKFGKPDVKLKRGQKIAVMLVLEGTYPYVSGGVSSWVHQIVGGMPNIKFGIIFVGGDPDLYQDSKYKLPPNLVHLEEHFLATGAIREQPHPHHGDAEFFKVSGEVHDFFRDQTGCLPAQLLKTLAKPLAEQPEMALKDFLYSELSWQEITRRYHRNCSHLSFVDYFWTIRSVHAPLFTLARAAKVAPKAAVYHTVSTGFAGFCGSILGQTTGRPLILTEHGIYTKERRIELLAAQWLAEAAPELGADAAGGIDYIRRLWIRFFEGMGRLTYTVANPIISLYDGNRQRQIKDGAAEERASVIPNGIDLARLVPLRAKRPAKIPRVVGLLGRVVPIKDVKTFIRMMRVLANSIEDVEGWIIGPDDEDTTYANECKSLVASLDLEKHVKFLGFQRIEDVLPKLGLMVLTSISEAQPLALLEGFAAGVPCVSTEVGCCRELVYGTTAQDRALGASGRIVPIAKPEAAAEAVAELLLDPNAWSLAQQAGIARVEKFYTLEKMIARYQDVYQEAIARRWQE